MIDCNLCIHVNTTEYEQDLIKEKLNTAVDHYCTKHKVRLFHNGAHPRIKSCSTCTGCTYRNKFFQILQWEG